MSQLLHEGPFIEGDMNDDSVVISGMSGIMPGCRNIYRFAERLYNKENFTTSTSTRWQSSYPETCRYHGLLPGLCEFDSQFFMVFAQLSHKMDTSSRKFLEHSFQALFDAGISPSSLSGKSVAVYTAASVCEAEKAFISSTEQHGVVGSSRTMFANRISYYLNLKGPSLALSGDGGGAVAALERAHQLVRSGQCEAAIVGASKLLLHPQTSLHYHRLVPANPDGKTKCYDMNADGQTSSESINVIILQKYKDAKRVYARLRHVKTGFDNSPEKPLNQKFGTYRDPTCFAQFLEEFYKEAGVDPSLVEYIDGFGAAIPETDKAELEAFEKVFCKERKEPLLFGSIMSNVGYTDSASGSIALIKMLLAYQRGEIAASINCKNPRNDIQAIRDGRMQMVRDNHPFKRTFAAINTLSVAGINGHILLEGCYKPKIEYHSPIPYLVTVSGRQEAPVHKILDDIKNHPLDPEKIDLLNSFHKARIPKHLARGFGIYETNDKNETVVLKEKIDHSDHARRPLWFVYSGMGSQWAGMGAQLMRIPVFATAIERCQKVLEPRGVNLLHIITTEYKNIFDNILNAFVGIAAIQIGITDVLKAVGIEPDNIIGHSVGELGCAYADGCCSAEEMILMAYSRGRVSLDTPFIKGSMAAVGIGFKQISSMLPPEIEVACHNSPESCTISGPVEVVTPFVASLVAKGIFAKEVACANIAYHSRYIAAGGPKLLACLREVAPALRRRSKRWLSTSVPRESWSNTSTQYSSPEYHTNNLLNPVLFEETSALIPPNAVLVEIAPHGLLQAIIKRSLPESCCYLPLTRRGYEDNAVFLLEALGNLYIEGFNVDVSALYPTVEYPVSTETPLLSHLVEWAYAEKMTLTTFVNVDRRQNTFYKPIICLQDEEWNYLRGNIIEGTTLFPFSGVLELVWETLAMVLQKPKKHLSVQLKNLKLYKEPELNEQKALYLTISVQRGSGRFEATYEDGLIADGYINVVPKQTQFQAYDDEIDSTIELKDEDIYKLLFESGYGYKGEFRSIHNSNQTFTQASLIWRDNWTTFIDGALQLAALKHGSNGISKPRYISRICIETGIHSNEVHDLGDKNTILAASLNDVQIRCGGVLIEQISFKDKPALKQVVILKEKTFVPYIKDETDDISNSLNIYLQMVAENVNKRILNVYYASKPVNSTLLDKVSKSLNKLLGIELNVIEVTKDDVLKNEDKVRDIDLVIIHGLLCDKQVAEALSHTVPSNTFLISLEVDTSDIPQSICRQICSIGEGKDRMDLAVWRLSKPVDYNLAVTVKTADQIECLNNAKATMLPNQSLLVLTTYPPVLGLKDLIKKWRAESTRNQIYLAMISEDSENDLCDLPQFDLAFNVLRNGVWGGDYYVPWKEEEVPSTNATLQSLHLGDISALQWLESVNIIKPENSVKVHFAGLSAFDVKRATGEFSTIKTDDSSFGLDYSGVTDKGDRVMGLKRKGAISRRIIPNPNLLWPVPDHWSLEDAATVPLPYALSFYCLYIKCKLVSGMRILVHGGTGGVGLAAISIALANGCEIFATVSDVRKKRFLCKMFPDLPAENIGNSRDNSFSDMVLSATKGNGCDIIISTVKKDLKQDTLRCCIASGTTMDLYQVYSQENYSYGMFNMTKARSYMAIDFLSVLEGTDKNIQETLQYLVAEGIARGYVRPLSRVVYEPHEVKRAFQLVAASRHRGRVLIRLNDYIIAPRRMICSSEGCHLLITDQDGFGLYWAERLVKNGVQNLIIHSKGDMCSSYLRLKLKSWKSQGVNMQHISNDMSTMKDVQSILNTCNGISPIEGIHYMAVGTKSKANIVIEYLDTTSRAYPSLKYFVVVSEKLEIGEEIVRHRQCDGLPAVAAVLTDLEKCDPKGSCDEYKEINDFMKWNQAADIIEKAVAINSKLIVAYAYNSDEIIEIKPKAGGTKTEVEDQEGLESYIQHIDPDELLVNSELIIMRTLVHNSPLRFDEFDDLTYLCVVPGLEGLHYRFEGLSERLKIPTIVLNPGYEHADETVVQMAQRFVNVMMKMLKLKDKFHLLGYETGVQIVFEMAKLLEIRGFTGTVYCVGGLPEDIKDELQRKLEPVHTADFQNKFIRHMYALMGGISPVRLETALKDLTDWTKKVNICVKIIRSEVSYSSQYIRDVLETVYARIKMLCSYCPEVHQLRSKIIVLRSIPMHRKYENMDLNMIEHKLKSSLCDMLGDLKCPTIVNKYLDSNILQEYNSRAHCESYLMCNGLTLRHGLIDD